MKSTLARLILMGPTIVFAGCQSVVGSCPQLSAPPAAAIDALQGAHNGAVDAWVVDLDRHYQKLAVCKGAK